MNNKFTSFPVLLIPFLFIMLFSGCGGGGSSKTVTPPNTVNRAPSAQFSVSANPENINVAIVFDSSGSSDPDAGDTLIYSWQFGDGLTSQEQNPSHSYTAAGTFQASLVVTDDKGLSSPSFTLDLIINDPSSPSNHAPTASFTVNPNPAIVDQSVTFDASGSSDPDVGDVLSYAWNFGDGSSSSSISPTHSYSATGNFTVILTVMDDKEASSDPFQTVVTINSNGGNNAPEASFTISPNPAQVGTEVVFDSSGSTDIDGDSLTYDWQFGDGITSQLANPVHSYQTIGSFNVQLVVTDSQGLESTPFVLSISTTSSIQYSAPPEPWPETKDLNVIWFGASTTAHNPGSNPSYNIPQMTQQIYQASLPDNITDQGELSINTAGHTSLTDWLARSEFNMVESGPSKGSGNWDYVIATAIQNMEGAGNSEVPVGGTQAIYDALKRVKDSTKADTYVNYPVPRLNGYFQIDTDSEALLTRFECTHVLANAEGAPILNGPTSIAMDTVYQSLPNPDLIARLKTYAQFPSDFPSDFNETRNIFLFDESSSDTTSHYAQPGSFFVANIFAVYLYGINPIGLPAMDFTGYCASNPSHPKCAMSDNLKIFLQAVAYDGVYRYRLGERPKRNGSPISCDVGDQITIQGQREDAYLQSVFGG